MLSLTLFNYTTQNQTFFIQVACGTTYWQAMQLYQAMHWIFIEDYIDLCEIFFVFLDDEEAFASTQYIINMGDRIKIVFYDIMFIIIEEVECIGFYDPDERQCLTQCPVLSLNGICVNACPRNYFTVSSFCVLHCPSGYVTSGN
jgi:hypothetical protein